ncbi:hypothetical protein J4732_14995 [Serratia marcescens]|uniref:Uncharacterized protein n=1 Tax=Serratia marcescens TaxID=615 RepID=A0A939SRA3_SERMA|nr:hypothetical protein [Serratia marcescens]
MKGFIKQANKGYEDNKWVLPSIHTGGALTVEAAKGVSADVKVKTAVRCKAPSTPRVRRAPPDQRSEQAQRRSGARSKTPTTAGLQKPAPEPGGGGGDRHRSSGGDRWQFTGGHGSSPALPAPWAAGGNQRRSHGRDVFAGLPCGGGAGGEPWQPVKNSAGAGQQ